MTFTTGCSICGAFEGTICITALEPLESKLNHLARTISGLRKLDSFRAVRERNQILTLKELHLKENPKVIGHCFER